MNESKSCAPENVTTATTRMSPKFVVCPASVAGIYAGWVVRISLAISRSVSLSLSQSGAALASEFYRGNETNGPHSDLSLP